MKLSSNTVKFHHKVGLKKTIDIFSDAGFEGIDFSMDMEEYHTDAHDPDFYRQIRQYAGDRGIGFYQTHAPFPSNFPEEEKNRQRFDEIVTGMHFSSLLGAEMIVLHPCRHFSAAQEATRDFLMEYNRNFFKTLIPYARSFGLRIAIENIHGDITATPENLIELLDSLDSDVFTVCIDVGHAKLAGQDPAEMIRKLGGRIGCTHIHDNDGKSDQHTLPYCGVLDWESIMKALAEIGYAGSLSYEASPFVSAIPNDFLPESARYMAKVGRYLISRVQYYKSIL